MIIWGWRTVSLTLSQGVFFCPTEAADREYLHRSARRWFTLFFIPLIPLDHLGEYVECTSCGNTYYPRILDSPTNSEISASLALAARAIAVAVATADGTPPPDQADAAMSFVRRTIDYDYSLADFQSDMTELNGALEPNLLSIAPALTERGKEQLLLEALVVAAGDGGISNDEMNTVLAVGESLGMLPNHVRGVVHAFANSVPD